MQRRHLTILLTLLLPLFLLSLEAQENQEPPHAYFELSHERRLPLYAAGNDTGTRSISFSFKRLPQWDGKLVFIRIPGVHQPYSLLINKFRFGSDPGRGHVSEFNITPFLKEGVNAVDLVVTGEQLWESFNTCPMKGETMLVTRDPVHVRDVAVTTYHEAEETEVLVRIQLFIKSYLTSKNEGRKLMIEVTDPSGDPVFFQAEKLDHPLAYGQKTEMVFDWTLENPLLWSPGSPHLYKVRIELKDKETGDTETTTTGFGVRTAFLSDTALVMNGDTIPIVLAEPGTAGSLACMTVKAAETILESGSFNAIRTDVPLPYNLVSLLNSYGVLVLRRATDEGLPGDRSLINDPEIIWIR